MLFLASKINWSGPDQKCPYGLRFSKYYSKNWYFQSIKFGDFKKLRFLFSILRFSEYYIVFRNFQPRIKILIFSRKFLNLHFFSILKFHWNFQNFDIFKKISKFPFFQFLFSILGFEICTKLPFSNFGDTQFYNSGYSLPNQYNTTRYFALIFAAD